MTLIGEAEEELSICRHCLASLPGTVRFCPECGKKNIPALSLQRSHYFLLPILTAILFCFSWFTARHIAGEKPTRKFDAPDHPATIAMEDDPELKALRAAAKAAPDSPANWRALALTLRSRMQEMRQPPDELYFELIDALSQAISLDGADRESLILLADIAFERKAFAKSIELYRDYLRLAPDDFLVKARLASALTFLGQVDEAISMLTAMLEEDPEHFQARAYLSIAYTEKGNLQLALQQGEIALLHAPHESARERFGAFLESVKKKLAETEGASPSVSGSLHPLEQFLKKHPITGERFLRLEQSTDEIRLFFHDFPMSQMPPVAKEKFLGRIRSALGKNTAKTLVFIDEPSSGEMLRVPVHPAQ